MTSQQAKDALLLYRPGTSDAEDPQIAEALELASRDHDLGAWLESHRAFQKALRRNFREIQPPAHLKASLLIRAAAQPAIVTPRIWWRQPLPVALAATLVLLLGIVFFVLPSPHSDRFANYQARMVSTALREYRMDLVTNDMSQVREYLAGRGAPANYDLPAGLEKLQLTGAGFLRWRSNPVSMVCFNRGDNQMLFLFVMNRSALKDAPAETLTLGSIASLTTVSWSRGDKTYLLAGPEDPDFKAKYLTPSS